MGCGQVLRQGCLEYMSAMWNGENARPILSCAHVTCKVRKNDTSVAFQVHSKYETVGVKMCKNKCLSGHHQTAQTYSLKSETTTKVTETWTDSNAI